jgi:hypothetical protein
MKYIGFVYETWNRVTGKKYIGSHVGKDTDIYFGSDIDLLEDLKRYGRNIFDRKILEYASDQKELAIIEEKWLRSVDAKNNKFYYNKSNLASGIHRQIKDLPNRPLCSSCHSRLAAINCYRHGKAYYRSVCDDCARKKKKHKPPVPRWQASGYKKKMVCDRCGFRARSSAQMLVYHVNGDLNDSDLRNLKTVCLNCSVEVIREDLPWQRGDLEEDR